MDFRLEAYVDADFTGLWGIKETQDSTCVKSRTGYLIHLGRCPIISRSKLQTLISVSTMDAFDVHERVDSVKADLCRPQQLL